MKGQVPILFVVLLLAGCATSTVAKRKVERPSAYDALSPQNRALVDQGQIKVGLPMDAVYIAWGKPSQTSTGQTSDGKTFTTWIYLGTTWQEYRYWNYRYYPYHGRYTYPSPTLDYDYIPRSYVSAEVIFEDGIVKTWHSQPPQP